MSADGALADGGVVFQVVAPDGDGVPTVVESPPISSADELRWQPLTRVGRLAPLVVRWTDGEQVLGETKIETSDEPGSPSRALAATDTLVVRVGGSAEPMPGAAEEGAVFAAVDDPVDLPIDAAGYEAVDLLIVSTSNAEAWRDTALGPRVAAFRAWVRSGGRVLLSLGAGAEAVVGEGGPLAWLSPGRFSRVVSLPDTSPLERYTDAETPLDARLRVVQLEAARGVIEAHGPGRPSDLPLLVRAPLGLGEVLTAAFDLDDPELAAWPERRRLLSRLLGVERRSGQGLAENPGGQLRASSRELATLLKAKLGSRFAGVSVTPFLAIVAAAIVYLALAGPGDYFFVKRTLKRMSLTWLTFPLLVVATTAAAVAIGAAGRPAGPVVNQIELFDVDTQTGAARGALWAEVYSPSGVRRDVAVEPRGPDDRPLAGADARLGWLGAPGSGLLGMRSSNGRSADGGGLRGAYLLAGPRVMGVPIRAASTKSLAARWVAEAPGLFEADLTLDRNGLVEGTLINATGAPLRRARLLHGEWAWRLGTIADGQSVLVDEGLAPLRLTSLVKADLLGADAGQRNRTIAADRLDAAGLLRLMLFHRRLGGAGYSGRELRHQRFADLSHLLAAGRAVVLAEAGGPRSRLVDAATGEPLAEPSSDTTTFYRFVLPVGSSPLAPRPSLLP